MLTTTRRTTRLPESLLEMGDAVKPVDAGGLTSEGVFEQYGTAIRRYILRLVRNRAEADDLTQETFLRVHRKLDTLQDPATLSTWLYRIATHVCYDRFRQASYRHAAKISGADPDGDGAGDALLDAETPRLGEVIERSEMSGCVRNYIENLSDSYRTVVLLHDLHEMTNPEIAQALECSLATVKIRLHRARLRLKKALAAGCDFSHDERGVLVCEPKAAGE